MHVSIIPFIVYLDCMFLKLVSKLHVFALLNYVQLLISFLGEAGGLALFFVFSLKWKKESRKIFWAGLSSYLILLVLLPTIKYIIHRPRPFVFLSNFTPLLSKEMIFDASLPSSHAAFAYALTYVFKQGMPFSKRTHFLTYLAPLIAFSRVYIGVHYPSDIFFGAFIGRFVASFMCDHLNLSLAEKMYTDMELVENITFLKNENR